MYPHAMEQTTEAKKEPETRRTVRVPEDVWREIQEMARRRGLSAAKYLIKCHQNEVVRSAR